MTFVFDLGLGPHGRHLTFLRPWNMCYGSQDNVYSDLLRNAEAIWEVRAREMQGAAPKGFGAEAESIGSIIRSPENVNLL